MAEIDLLSKRRAEGYERVVMTENIALSQVNFLDIYEAVAGEKILLLTTKPNEREHLSFIGCKPRHSLSAKNKKVWLDGKLLEEQSPLPILDKWQQKAKTVYVEKADSLPLFVGGVMGFLGYEAYQYIENIPSHSVDLDKLPDAYFFLFDGFFAYNHQTEVLFFGLAAENDEEWQNFKVEVKEKLLPTLKKKIQSLEVREKNNELSLSSFDPMPEDDYHAVIERIKEYIASGYTYQVNYSYRMSGKSPFSPLNVFKRLALEAPAFQAAFIEAKDFSILSASPERLFSVREGMIHSRPIKGTRRQGRTKEEEEVFTLELQNDPKEQAEHAMLVDLVRNDLSRVCEPGSVHMPHLMEVIPYSYVLHLESSIVGKLKSNIPVSEILRSLFPGGSITGVPKIETIRIIKELEESTRGIYTGSIGYISYSGNMDFNIAIRTICAKGQKFSFSVGGGITYKASAKYEYKETRNKAFPILKSLSCQKEFT